MEEIMWFQKVNSTLRYVLFILAVYSELFLQCAELNIARKKFT